MKEPENIFQFLTNTLKFIDQNTYTLNLKVDENNVVNDLPCFYNDQNNAPGGIIADMKNCSSEILYNLEQHYTENGCKKELNKLLKLKAKFYHL